MKNVAGKQSNTRGEVDGRSAGRNQAMRGTRAKVGRVVSSRSETPRLPVNVERSLMIPQLHQGKLHIIKIASPLPMHPTFFYPNPILASLKVGQQKDY